MIIKKIATRVLILITNLQLFSTRRLLMMSAAKGSLLSCQMNAYIKESHNRVVQCEKIPEKESYRVILDDSVLYPEGGGQPYDLGTVNGLQVLKVLKPAKGEAGVELEVSGPLPEGEEVKCEVDWNRRYDFMQQHTAQHLFSAIAYKMFKADTVGWSLGNESVSVDLASQPMLTASQISAVEEEVNACIRRNHRVDFKMYSKDDLSSPSNEKYPELQDLRGVVKGAALDMEELRLVLIEGLDVNPCGGTHLQSLAEINLLKVIGTEKDRNAMRVRFVAGQRALNYFRQCVQREALLSQKLSVPPVDQVQAVEKLQKERKEVLKKLDTYADELAELWGHSLAQSLPSGKTFVVKFREGADLKFLLKAAAKAQESKSDAIFFLASHDQNVSGPFVLFGDATVINKSKEEIFALISGRGGGKPGKMQGYAQSLDNLDRIQQILETNLSS